MTTCHSMYKPFPSMGIYEILLSSPDFAGMCMGEPGTRMPTRGRLASKQFQVVLGDNNE
ncbi:MAG: hypothetical protein MK108_01260 [Mariniblastus sp.]|nr:hypothetical protein [Mariniblastus sp.]